jgi:hypothetical protein
MPIITTLLATWAVASSSIALSFSPPPAPDPVEDTLVIDEEDAEVPAVAEAGEPADAIPPDPGAIPLPVEPVDVAAPAPAAIEAPVVPTVGEAIAPAVVPTMDVPQVDDPLAGADGELSLEDANAAIAAGAEPQGETLDEAHPGMDPKEYLALLKEILAAQREKVAERLEEKIAAKQEAKMATLSSILGWISLLGLFLLLMPLPLRKKYPGQDKLLLEYSALAAGTFIVAVWLFSRVVLLLKAIQGALSSLTNPQVAVIDATFSVLENNAEDLVDLGPTLIEAPLAQVASGEQDSLPMAILDNISRINEDITVFKNIARQFEGVFALFGYLPIVLTIVAVVLFVVSIKPVIVSIVAMPGRVAAGEAKAAEVVKDVFRTVGRELLATLCLIGALVVVTIFSGIMLSLAVEPAIEAFLAYVFTSVIYTMAAPEFSKFAVYTSVTGALLFLVLNVAIVLVANVLFLGKMQKIFKRRFHDKVPVGAHKRFWGWGSLSLVWAHVLPVVFVAIAQEGIGKLVDSMTSGEDISWTALLVSGPAILVFGFILVFWAARGLKAIAFIMKYRPQDVQAPNGRVPTQRYRSPAVT